MARGLERVTPGRAGQVRLLAELLSAHPHSRVVTARWRAEPGEPAGCWTLSWTDGPDVDTMSCWARELIAATPRLAGLDAHGLWWRRVHSPTAWAGLLLRSAGPDPYRSPVQWRSAEQLHGYVADVIDQYGWLDEPEGTSFGPRTGPPEEGIDRTFILYAGPSQITD